MHPLGANNRGKKLADSIVREKLAACVNIVPGTESIYFWNGEIQTDSEELLIIKTRESLLEALTEHVKSNHEYEVLEVIAIPNTGGNLKYLEWIKNNRSLVAGKNQGRKLFPFFLQSLVAGKNQKQKIYGFLWERNEKPTGCISLSIWQAHAGSTCHASE